MKCLFHICYKTYLMISKPQQKCIILDDSYGPVNELSLEKGFSFSHWRRKLCLIWWFVCQAQCLGDADAVELAEVTCSLREICPTITDLNCFLMSLLYSSRSSGSFRRRATFPFNLSRQRSQLSGSVGCGSFHGRRTS